MIGLDKKISFVKMIGTLLVIMVWISSCLFGLYIIAYYAGGYASGNLTKWNSSALPNLYEEGYPNAIRGVGLHFVFGGIILMMGSIQFIEGIRDRFILVHRWVGRVYVVACIFTAIGGLIYIFVKGTIGGIVMNVGFAGYGVAMLLCGVQTIRLARKKDIDQHRAWAIRLYALAIGSWLYRMYYGLNSVAGLGWHQADFLSTFDYIMDFFFWIPNLLVAEFFIRSSVNTLPKWLQYIGAFILLLAIIFIAAATYKVTRYMWGPAILEMIGMG
jgi:hypothetical protein